MVDQLDTQLRVRRKYYADTAQREYEKSRLRCVKPRKQEAAKAFIQKAGDLILREKYSPDAAVHRVSETLGLKNPPISTETMYRYIHHRYLRVKVSRQPLEFQAVLLYHL
jgi:IS30 family transposase